MIWLIFGLVFFGGCVGGLSNAVIAGGLEMPHRDSKANVWHPGWFGNVLVGGVAAVVFWGLYGSLAKASVFGPPPAVITFSVAEFVGSIVSGIGGARLLTVEVDRKILKSEAKALAEARDELGSTLETVMKIKGIGQ
ncbi:MAG: hypothetical protein ABIQ65_13320 [Thermoanaerobaculia bacterium]